MNVTLSVPDDVVERAREVARQQGSSLNAMIRHYLERLAGEQQGEDLAAQFDMLWQAHPGHSGGWRFKRDELYEDRVGGGQ